MAEPDPILRPLKLPLIAIRDVVLFPHMALPLSVGREKSIRALEDAIQKDRLVFAVTQKKSQIEDPKTEDLYTTGVLSELSQFLRMPDNSFKVILQGIQRTKALRLQLAPSGSFWEAEVEYPPEPHEKSPEMDALMRHTFQIFEQYAKLSRRVSQEAITALQQVDDPSRLADTIAANVIVKIEDRQTLLEIIHPKNRLEKLIELLNAELEIQNIERKIHTRVRTQIEKTQKEYYLTEQMKAIQKELRQKDDFAKELDELKTKVKQAKMSKAAEETALKELARLEKMMPFSPEATVSRTYLDWLIHIPWSKKTKDNLDLNRAKKILDEDHYGLEKIKERILEYIAVCKLTKKLTGPILCFVGPPGVGKTSLGRSIARSMNRKFVRMSLGGVRDEAEIRGHRRTYIGSLPGRLIQSMRKVESRNPVFILDEIDKMGMDWRGDPAAALLEVLDPEQNHSFLDHYLDVDFDLSQVLFITTANTLDGIPVSLQDRLEILRFSGYTHREKVAIAQNYLIPKQLKDHGLDPKQVTITPRALEKVIHEYTREAGVRNLEREIASLSRKLTKKFVEDNSKTVEVTEESIPKLLGIPKFHQEHVSPNAVGVSTGLAWTEHGGELLAIEVVSHPGKGTLLLTGKLGSVMQESAQAAFSFVKSMAAYMGVSPSIFKTKDFHIHVPEGAIPKDGPSAGIAIATALASQVSGKTVLIDLAMTGEITLRGRVLPIGGLKEKVMAAHREKIKVILFPDSNRKDLEEIPKDIQTDLKLIPVKHASEVLRIALSLKTSKNKGSKKVISSPSRGILRRPRQSPQIQPGYDTPGAA
ncbi:MAG: endopeptidase La [Elusimicrobia bacterium]|nr:endopeptidase La [Elusimicrobiota bacterium]